MWINAQVRHREMVEMAVLKQLQGEHTSHQAINVQHTGQVTEALKEHVPTGPLMRPTLGKRVAVVGSANQDRSSSPSRNNEK